jgi:ferredoxin--NADP+ reductase
VRVTRPAGFEFLPGQFARIGLPEEGSQEPTLWRAYSMVTHPDDDALEFFSVTVPNGLFSPKLAALQPGQPLWIENKPFGFLTLDRFSCASVLWLISTGTGLSAYLPMIRDAATLKQFERVVLVHGVRTELELAYRFEIEQIMNSINARRQDGFVYLPVTSRQPWPGPGSEAGTPASRITTALLDGTLEKRAGVKLEPEGSRVMLCGNPEMVTEMRKMLSERGFAAGRRGNLGTLAVENYW